MKNKKKIDNEITNTLLYIFQNEYKTTTECNVSIMLIYAYR